MIACVKRAVCTLGLTVLLSAPLFAVRPVTIAAIGDSTTAGTPFFSSPLESPPTDSEDPEGQYGHWMMRRRSGWKVLNLGIAGQRSEEIRQRLDAAFGFSPEFIVILAGV